MISVPFPTWYLPLFLTLLIQSNLSLDRGEPAQTNFRLHIVNVGCRLLLEAGGSNLPSF